MNPTQQVQNTLQSVGKANKLPIAIDVIDTQTLTISATFLPQDYVDQQQALIDNSNANIASYTQAMADRDQEKLGYQQLIVDEQTTIDTAQANIDAVVNAIPGLVPVSSAG